MRASLAVLGLLLGAVSVVAQPHHRDLQEPVIDSYAGEILTADRVNRFSRVDAPPLPHGLAMRVPASEFIVEIENEIPEASAAIHYAAELWASHVTSTVPIQVTVRWITLPEHVLGNAVPNVIANFPAAPRPNTFFPAALANAIEGRNIFPDHNDITVNLNQAFGPWYFGVDGQPPADAFDLVTVMLHEIGHGLGFLGTMDVSGEIGRWGTGTPRRPLIFDIFAETDFQGLTSPLLDTWRFPNPSILLGEALQSEEVYFNGPTAIAAQIHSAQIDEATTNIPPGGRPKLHAPDEWVPGSSYNHLTEETDEDDEQIYYPAGSINSLMTPRLAATEVIHTPGPITCGLMRDIGWTLGIECLALLPDDLPTSPLDEVPEVVVAGPCPHPAVGGQTAVQIYVSRQTHVVADLFDVMGRRVARVVEREVPASTPTFSNDTPVCTPGAPGNVALNLRGMAAGMYVLRIETSAGVVARRVVNVP